MSKKDYEQVKYKVGNYYDIEGETQVKIVQLDIKNERILGSDGFWRDEFGRFDTGRPSSLDLVKLYKKVDK